MAWTTPHTAVLNETLSAATWNAQVRDNFLMTLPAILSNVSDYPVTTAANTLAARYATRGVVLTSQSTASTSYTDLATPGPSVTITTGTRALVMVQTEAVINAVALHAASYEVSGATTVAASDSWAVTDSDAHNMTRTSCHLHEGLTAGSNTFKMKYRVTGGTGTWRYRIIMVMPL
jgi:hypothetical protein